MLLEKPNGFLTSYRLLLNTKIIFQNLLNLEFDNCHIGMNNPKKERKKTKFTLIFDWVKEKET